MDKNKTSYVIGFALIVCIVCSMSLAFVSEGLRARKETNEANDIKKNILKAVRLENPLSQKASSQEVLKAYSEMMSEIVVNEEGQVVESAPTTQTAEGETLFPLYVYSEGQEVKAYCFPIEGKGLWSTLYGYLALEPDVETVRGITFYKHGETPGLGGEIETVWFQDNFVGKRIWDEDQQILRPIVLVKGKVEDQLPEGDQDFYVDGISGATMTSKGVTALLEKCLKTFEPYFQRIRK